jgi:hypothetical protein
MVVTASQTAAKKSGKKTAKFFSNKPVNLPGILPCAAPGMRRHTTGGDECAPQFVCSAAGRLFTCSADPADALLEAPPWKA